ncbi:abscisic acid receptor PYL4-like [Canna indica]|uniref:Abscisic acid receptor PYL4-like n=1 Tax=Canna indica TaxID=4628 RepID=A0AAQ3KYT6_9LILI|nr:abscisic acid receptor PYL4-like [Canna indica]
MTCFPSKKTFVEQEKAAGIRGCAVTADPISCMAHEVPATVARHHDHVVGPNQCCSAVVQTVAAPVAAVWSLVRRFDTPQAYKHFVKSCDVIVGDGAVGTLRRVRVISGLPAATSTERLEILDDEKHVLSFRVVGGGGGGGRTVVVESYVVDVPPGNTTEETRMFVDTIVKCNLQSLAQITEHRVIE